MSDGQVISISRCQDLADHFALRQTFGTQTVTLLTSLTALRTTGTRPITSLL